MVFATLLGGLPSPPAELGDPLDVVLRAQEDAGLELLTDGRLATGHLADLASRFEGVERTAGGGLRLAAVPARTQPLAIEAWTATAARTARAVKQALPGPYSMYRGLDIGGKDPDAVIVALALAIREEALALAAAGCPFVEIEETEAHRIGEDPAERTRFREAHRLLAGEPVGTHLSLSIVGGSAASAGVETIVAAPYASLAVDLIAGPDNWYLVVATPGDRGIVAGVFEPKAGSDDRPELPVWAANYAASTGGRTLARVGLGTAGSLAHLTWPVAEKKLRRLGEAAHVAGLPPARQVAALDPRAVDIRTAAMGRAAPPAKHPARRRP